MDSDPGDARLGRRRAELRRSLLRVSTAGLVIVLIVVGLAIAAVLAAFRSQRHAQRAERATTQAKAELRKSYVAQARAGRLSAAMGSKESGLAAVAAAARIQPGIETRNEAVAHLALLDLRDTGLRWAQRGSGQLVVFDSALAQFALCASATELVIGRVADQEIVCRHANPLIRLDRPLEFSPDGSHLAVAYGHQLLMMFNVSAQTPAFWAPSAEVVRGVSFSPDGALTAYVHSDRSIRVVRTVDGTEARRLPADGQPYLVHFDSEGKRLAITAGRRLQVWAWETNKVLWRVTHDDTITSLAWKGALLAYGDEKGELILRHEIAGTSRRFVAHQGRVSDLQLVPDGAHVMSVSYDGSTRWWDAHSGRLLVSTTAGYGRQVARDGQRVAYANAQGWGLWEVRRPLGYRAVSTVDGLKPGVLHLDFAPDGTLLSMAKEGGLQVAEAETGEVLLRHRKNGLAAWAQFLPDGKTLLTAPRGALALRSYAPKDLPLSRPRTEDGGSTPAALTIESKAPIPMPPGGPMERGRQVIEWGSERRIELPEGTSAGIGALSPDRSKAVFPLDRTSLGVVDLQEPYALRRFVGAGRPLRPALGPADTWMVSGSLHGAGTLLWDAANGKLQRQLIRGNAHCYANADGSLVAVAGSDSCRVYRASTWNLIQEIPSERGTELPSYAAFSADGRLFAVVKDNSRIQLWDPRDWRLLADLTSPDPQIISCLAFSPNAKRLAVGTNRDRVELWDLEGLRLALAGMGLDWSDGPEAADVGPGIAAGAGADGGTPEPARDAGSALLLMFTVGGGVILALLCAAFVQRRQRELIRAHLDADRQMGLRNRQLAAARVEILHSQKMKALGTLAAGVAHDFNNLLSIIRMANKLTAKQAQSDPEIQDNVRLVEKAVGQGKQLVNSMLGYSREPGGELAPGSVAEVVENAVNLLRKQFLAGLEVQLDLDRSLPPLRMARGRLEQILLNLIVNASEAMKGRGTLRLALREAPARSADWVLPPATAPRYLELIIADTGPGIPPEILPRIFEPFFTTKNAGAIRGTGLGLSMVYSLAQNDGLGLRIESLPGQGTTFSVILPVADGPRP